MMWFIMEFVLVVFTYAKIQIWKQFTTTRLPLSSLTWLCLPMQRYKFESNSQQRFMVQPLTSSCVYLCKDTNLKAIHNISAIPLAMLVVVFTYAKIQIWKQFTTSYVQQQQFLQLCLPMQRYKFESNSQQRFMVQPLTSSCVYLCKDTNLKAIHNRFLKDVAQLSVVFTYAKIQIWKQFTTSFKTTADSDQLCLPMQRYKFESNSQRFSSCFTWLCSCVYLCKDTNLKAIHNVSVNSSRWALVVFTYAKIQIWKQFTTGFSTYVSKYGCVYLCKDTNLKAIHNVRVPKSYSLAVVFTYAKIQIWKQFTTKVQRNNKS